MAVEISEANKRTVALSNERQTTRRIPQLDGIRGLAISLVLVFHTVATFEAVPRTWLARVLLPFRLTWTGVDLFFVLSGFLIGGILLDAKGSPSYFQTFYWRRVHRIFPVYYLWLGLYCVGLYITQPDSAGGLLFQGVVPSWAYFLFVQNLFSPFVRSFGAPWMAATWSLAIEEQFYILLPLAIRRLSYRSITWFIVFSVCLAPVLRGILIFAYGADFVVVHPLLACRADALGFGVLGAILVRNDRAKDWLMNRRSVLWSAFGVLFVGMLILLRGVPWKVVGIVGYSVIAGYYFCFLLIAVLYRPRLLDRILTSFALRELGALSYAVYLLHTGIVWLVFVAVMKTTPQIVSVWTALVYLFAILVVFAIAYMSGKYFEQPLIKRAQRQYHY